MANPIRTLRELDRKSTKSLTRPGIANWTISKVAESDVLRRKIFLSEVFGKMYE
jgi:hypothetical protein